MPDARILERANERFLWTFNHDITTTGHYVKPTCSPGRFAIVRLQFDVDLTDLGVTLVRGEEVADTADAGLELGEIFEAIGRGITAGLDEVSPDGLPVRALKVTVLDVKVHPVDSLPDQFVEAARRAVHTAAADAGLVYLSP